ncbi:hypothetical protein CEXT_597571 [Caerostris extrusa]|uniref:Uncharacterized protein n=1 Tax=Caerostris extrusa TaxID=172846 RepID=A0AAV4T6V0_CAEEX|nr:hypothetical protein CEXT_597571 [Caerostris extrusa]
MNRDKRAGLTDKGDIVVVRVSSSSFSTCWIHVHWYSIFDLGLTTAALTGSFSLSDPWSLSGASSRTTGSGTRTPRQGLPDPSRPATAGTLAGRWARGLLVEHLTRRGQRYEQVATVWFAVAGVFVLTVSLDQHVVLVRVGVQGCRSENRLPVTTGSVTSSPGCECSVREVVPALTPDQRCLPDFSSTPKRAQLARLLARRGKRSARGGGRARLAHRFIRRIARPRVL